MHILVLASFYPSHIRPHTGNFFQAQVKALHREGHQVGVIVLPRLREMLHIWRQSLPRLPEITREDDDFPVYRMNHIWFPRIFPKICAWLVRVYGLRAYQQYVAEHGAPDVIHAHNIFYAGVLATQIKQKYGVPALNTEHSSNHINGRFFMPAQKHIIERTLAQLDMRIAVSDFLARALHQYHTQVHIVPNMIDTNHFQTAPRPSTSTFIFSAIGSLIPVKNFSLLIRAFAQACKGHNAHLNIGGDGKERSALEGLIADLDMSTQITLLGRLNQTQVRNLIHNSHVIVSSSHIETFGVTLIEAMACGRPVIATRSGGPDGFVTPQTGILADNNDLDALVNAMRTMIDNYATYDSVAIRAYCVEKFSEQAVSRLLVNHYHAIIGVRS